MYTEAEVRLAAQELVKHHGRLALTIATERAERMSRVGDQPSLGLALMVLTEVERMVGVLPQQRAA